MCAGACGGVCKSSMTRLEISRAVSSVLSLVNMGAQNPYTTGQYSLQLSKKN